MSECVSAHAWVKVQINSGEVWEAKLPNSSAAARELLTGQLGLIVCRRGKVSICVCVCGRKGERGRDAGVNVRVRKWDRRRFSETDCRKEETKHIDKKVCVFKRKERESHTKFCQTDEDGEKRREQAMTDARRRKRLCERKVSERC